MKLKQNLDTVTLFDKIVCWIETQREDEEAVLVLRGSGG